MPEISIIVPVFNTEKFIQRCIDSLRNQSIKEFELILIDDGSLDNCGMICDENAALDYRIKVIHQENKGVSSARNRGIKEAQGEYIMFCDSDDFLEFDWCEIMLATIREKKNNLVVTGYFLRETESNKTSNVKYSDKKEIVDKKDFFKLFERNQLNALWNKIYIREHILKNKIEFSPNITLGEDLLFNLDYLRTVDQITILPNSLYNYMRNGVESLDNKYYKDLFEIQTILYKRIWSEISYYNSDLSFYQEKFATCYCYAVINVVNNNFKKESKQSCAKRINKNKEILNDTYVQKVVRDSKIHFFYRLGIRSRCPILIFLIKWCLSVKMKVLK